MTSVTEPSASVDLAREPDFRLGDLEVSPSACRVRSGSQVQRVEPKVMEVLVVFARHADQTVSRDQLIEACWGGRIVSDDAVSRVVAQVRSLARSLDPPPCRLETVRKVGYRFKVSAAETPATADPPPAQASDSRRRWRAAAAAALVLAAGGVAVLAVRWLAPAPVAAWSDRDPRMTFA